MSENVDKIWRLLFWHNSQKTAGIYFNTYLPVPLYLAFLCAKNNFSQSNHNRNCSTFFSSITHTCCSHLIDTFTAYILVYRWQLFLKCDVTIVSFVYDFYLITYFFNFRFNATEINQRLLYLKHFQRMPVSTW